MFFEVSSLTYHSPITIRVRSYARVLIGLRPRDDRVLPGSPLLLIHSCYDPPAQRHAVGALV
jgi:hypothetical protein